MNELEQIQRACEESFGVQLKCKNRSRRFVNARFAYYYFCRKYTSLGHKRIAHFIGYDHATCVHALKHYEVIRDSDGFKELHEAVERKIERYFFSSEFVKTDPNKVIEHLYNQNAILRDKIRLLIKRSQTDANAAFRMIPPELVDDFIETRLKPYLKLNAKIDIQ